jgi:serine/threonine-protein kinase
LVGIGRPRPFDVVDPASQPTLVSSSAGPLVAWSDSHQDLRRRASFISMLDDALRRVSAPINFTPEANSAVQPTLLRSDTGLAAIYWDSGGKEPGVYVRRLDAEGRIQSPARLLSDVKRDKFYPTMTALPGGGFFAIWTEKKSRPSVTDLVGRRLDRDLAPIGPAVPLTAFLKGTATQPAATVYGGKLFITFRYGLNDLASNIQLLRIPLDAPELSTGVKPARHDVFAGEHVIVHGFGKNSEPTLACEKDGCFVAWDDETAGAVVAFVAQDQREPLWHRDFSSKGLRPTIIAADPSQIAGKAFVDAKAVVAYFADSRLRIAPITRDGVGTPSVISRVSGFQPRPAIVAGKKPGDWVVAFRDYEAGHLELFVAQASCGEQTSP